MSLTLAENRSKWKIVAVVAAILAIVMGQLVNGLSSFFTPLEQAYGWSRGDIALINTAGLVGIAFGGVAMGFLADRVGVRPVAMLGITVVAAGFAAASLADELWQLYLIFLLTGACGGGAVFGPVIALVGRWFTSGAGLALGLVAAGQAIGQGGVPYLNVLLIEAVGWRGAFAAFAAVTVLVLLPFAMMLRDPDERQATLSRAPELSPLPTGLVLVLMSLAVFWCCTLMSVPLMHLLPRMEYCGIPSAQAGSAVFVMMLAAIGGRIAFGRVADKVGGVQAWFLASFWQTSLVFVFAGLGSLPFFLLFAPVYGFGYGGVMTAVLATLKELTPAHHRSLATGIILAFAWVGHGFGGFAGGLLFDRTLDYIQTFGFAALAGLVNLVNVGALWFAVARPGQRVAAT